MIRILTGSLLLLTTLAAPAQAEFSSDEIRIAVLSDLSGPASDYAGQGNVVAAELAVQQFGGEVLGVPVRVIAADHQSYIDRSRTLAIELVEDDQVDMITGLDHDGVAVATQTYATRHGVITMTTGSGSPRLHNEFCSPLAFQWGFETNVMVSGILDATRTREGSDWYFITANSALGWDLQSAAEQQALSRGATVLGASRYEPGSFDLTTPIQLAIESDADVVALASTGEDTQQAIRQAYEMRLLSRDTELVALSMYLPDIRSVGLYVAHGMRFVTPYLWNHDDQSRALATAMRERTGVMPSMIHAATYSAVLSYLKAVRAAGTDEAAAVAQVLRSMPIDDGYARDARVRDDGLLVQDLFLVEVKRPGAVSAPYDYFEVIERIPASRAYAAAAERGCDTF
jgi:branched-chain amino acid transport system substrate-binding protein